MSIKDKNYKLFKETLEKNNLDSYFKLIEIEQNDVDDEKFLFKTDIPVGLMTLTSYVLIGEKLSSSRVVFDKVSNYKKKEKALQVINKINSEICVYPIKFYIDETDYIVAMTSNMYDKNNFDANIAIAMYFNLYETVKEYLSEVMNLF